MPISNAIDVVATVGSPNWLNIASAVSRIRSRVRVGGFCGIAFALPTSGAAPAQRPLEIAQRLFERLYAIPQLAFLTRLRRQALLAVENRPVELDAVAGEDGIQLVGAAPQLRERVAIGVFGEPAPIGVAEHVGEEDHFVVARRLEQNDVGGRVLPGVALHADAHARVDERAKSLRQHGHEAAIRVTNQPNRAMEQFFFAHRYTTDDNVAASREAARRMALDRWAVLDRYLGDNGRCIWASA